MIEIKLLAGAEQRRRAGPTLAPRGGQSGDFPSSTPAVALALAVAGLFALLWIGYGFWSVGARTAELEAALQRESADSAAFAAAFGQTDLLRARQDSILRRISVIKKVDQRRYVWPHLLDEISRAVPAFTWLTRLTTAEVPAPTATAADSAQVAVPGPSFSLEGSAASTQALTRFMKNLEASPYIEAVTLVTSAQQVADGRSFQQFTLEARYQEPDPALVRTIPLATLR